MNVSSFLKIIGQTDPDRNFQRQPRGSESSVVWIQLAILRIRLEMTVLSNPQRHMEAASHWARMAARLVQTLSEMQRMVRLFKAMYAKERMSRPTRSTASSSTCGSQPARASSSTCGSQPAPKLQQKEVTVTEGKVTMIRTRKGTGTTLVQVPMDMLAQAGMLRDPQEPMDMEVDQEGESEESSSEESVKEWFPLPIRNEDGTIKVRLEPKDVPKPKVTTKIVEQKPAKEKKECTSTRTTTTRNSTTAPSSHATTSSRASEIMAKGRMASASMTRAPMPTATDHHLQQEFPDHGGHVGSRDPQPYCFVPEISVEVRVGAEPTPPR